jgi:putative transposase
VPPPRYQWRALTPAQREELLAWRRDHAQPWHSPPHRPNFGHLQFLITAACYEHRAHIGRSRERMDQFSRDLTALLAFTDTRTFAWCVLPNHYHVFVETPDVPRLLRALGQFHGRTSHQWNGEEGTRGRKVFFRAVERAMRSEAHAFATLNYVHNNPVHHGYVTHWTEWPWSSAADYLAQTEASEARHVWRRYPVRDYGAGWDDPAL